MAEKKAEPKETKGSSSKMKLIVLILVVLLVLAAGGGAAYYFLFRGSADPAGEAAGEQHASETGHEPEHEPEHKPDKGEEDSGHGAEATAPIYHPLEPITVNISTPGPVRFLRLNLTLVARNELVIAAVDKHMPMIRNDLLTHLAGQDAAVINTPDGKTALREDLKKMMIGILIRAGEPTGIQDILFTDLVMQ